MVKVLSTLNRRLLMAHKWLVVYRQVKAVPRI
ncbi:Uncharacterised protein [Vibrio cholerae]|nr:Uncharacterised protein [Vibrio cholerae]